MNKLLSSIVFAGLVSLSGTSNAAAVYEQSWGNITGAQFSQGSYRVSDNFKLSSAASANDLKVWGTYWSSGNVPATPQFNVTIGSALGASDVFSANLNPYSIVDTGYDHNGVLGANLLEFSFNFGSLVSLLGNKDYYLSVFSLTNNGTNWAWQRSNVGDGQHWQNGNRIDLDAAFRIANIDNPSAVPLPAALPLMLSGLGILGFASRRRKKSV